MARHFIWSLDARIRGGPAASPEPPVDAARHLVRPSLAKLGVRREFAERPAREVHDRSELFLAQAELLDHVFGIGALQLDLVSRLQQFFTSGVSRDLSRTNQTGQMRLALVVSESRRQEP